jgi:hypothetical protein
MAMGKGAVKGGESSWREKRRWGWEEKALKKGGNGTLKKKMTEKERGRYKEVVGCRQK